MKRVSFRLEWMNVGWQSVEEKEEERVREASIDGEKSSIWEQELYR